MARIFSVSLQDKDLELIKWIDEMQLGGTLPSPSLVFRDAMMEKKKQWDIDNSESPRVLWEKIKNWQKRVYSQREFLEKKGLIDEYIEWDNKLEKSRDFPKQEIETIIKEGTKGGKGDENEGA